MSSYFSAEEDEYVDNFYLSLIHVLLAFKLIKTHPLDIHPRSAVDMYTRLMKYAPS